ncbi:MAG: tRNA (adenosine(37)-N6)-threonylcarbamoyltransferase complex dimerization subunit type 1 TsaB [Candidatus Gastranaerophilales bacterium]|nr:tRNA (adenosine(37)-N6)-threonylcarbamoyltransferase complex dimerization subunit type 1 TsaB [Candidatus Gastranaerophilales bacterium]
MILKKIYQRASYNKNMKILTFDTSTELMYVTISDDDNIKTSRTIESTKERYNSALLIPTIIELLKEQNITMQDIEAIGVNVGPGSFTGIRASATVARAIAQNLNIPVTGIPSLEIISLINNTDKNTLCLLDARRGKTYTAIYSPDGKIIQEPCVMDYDKVIEIAKTGDYFIIADNKMSGQLQESSLECINIQKESYDFGINLVKLTCKYLKEQETEELKWYNLKPLYIQPPPISMGVSMNS